MRPVEHEIYDGETPIPMPTSLQVQGVALQLRI